MALRRVKADVYHITGDCNYLALAVPGNKTILTVHDIAHYEHGLSGIKWFVYGLFWWWWPLRRVRCITSVSRFTCQKLHDVFGVPFSKLHVVYNPLFEGFGKSGKAFNEACPRILQIGSGKNKNVERLIEAVKGMSCKLVLVNKLSNDLKQQLKDNGIDYEWYNNLSMSEIQHLYRSADLLYFASTYEGFGLPIIEAFATGIPVVTSNTTSMPEIAGEAALLVDPGSTDQIREAIHLLISSAPKRNELIEAGEKRLVAFQPETVAAAYLDCYKQLYA
jgi:glycosyltransferase involved in cell wall biosynthesis